MFDNSKTKMRIGQWGCQSPSSLVVWRRNGTVIRCQVTLYKVVNIQSSLSSYWVETLHSLGKGHIQTKLEVNFNHVMSYLMYIFKTLSCRSVRAYSVTTSFCKV